MKRPFDYGKVGPLIADGEELAHRAAWVLTYGPIPDELFVLHRCDNPPCIRPIHLFLGTHEDNAEDRERKGRGVGGRGSLNSHAKLSERLILKIREEIKSKIEETGTKRGVLSLLASKYGVSRHTLSHIHCGRTWKGILT